MQQMPRHILHDGRVSREHRLGLDHATLLGRRVYVPQADCVVVTTNNNTFIYLFTYTAHNDITGYKSNTAMQQQKT